jgi:hypothetical protein
MKSITIASAFALALMSGTAMASSDKCNEPSDKWMSMDEARAKVTAMGYDVRKVEVDDGCYEAYGIKNGRKYEVYINPVTAEIVELEEDD